MLHGEANLLHGEANLLHGEANLLHGEDQIDDRGYKEDLLLKILDDVYNETNPEIHHVHSKKSSICQVYHFFKHVRSKGWEVFGTEVSVNSSPIGDVGVQIAGTIDLILRHKSSGEFILVDYKTCESMEKVLNKNISVDVTDWNKDMLCILQGVGDITTKTSRFTKIDQYSLQLLAYASMAVACGIGKVTQVVALTIMDNLQGVDFACVSSEYVEEGLFCGGDQMHPSSVHPSSVHPSSVQPSSVQPSTTST